MGQPEPDPEVIELSLQLAGLSITVRGSPARAVDFVRELAAASEASVQSLTSSGDTRASLLASFPACPAHWISRAATHLSGSQLSGAWLLGTCCVRGKSQFAKQD